jgi:transcriptional regulator with XRE-family HTH domain
MFRSGRTKGCVLMSASRPEHRRDLGVFLRRQRMRTRVADYGFPEGRRRTPGLRREELALLAGVSPTWYTHLEQGRDIRPSPEVLDRLGEVLGLVEDELNYMHLLALGQRPSRTLKAATTEIVDLVSQLIQHHGHPAYVSNVASDILAWNAATTEWYTDFAKIPRRQRNLAWWMFNVPEARVHFVDFEAEARNLLGLVRGGLVRLEDFSRLDQVPVLAELLRTNELAQEWWRAYRVHDHVPCIRHLQREDGMRKRFQLLPLFEIFGYDLGVVFHVPFDGDPAQLDLA